MRGFLDDDWLNDNADKFARQGIPRIDGLAKTGLIGPEEHNPDLDDDAPDVGAMEI